jgi:hypothetical protein
MGHFDYPELHMLIALGVIWAFYRYGERRS